ncbi:pentapeptide repeat-containing protein [Chroococcidiopsis sp. SAG 2025]|uniref:pentapeptide repeat-containing protein n=1 Tax=Chroococcidiopsis sp. SAG 2025 TaxID=171389 RepID=UPI003977E20E
MLNILILLLELHRYAQKQDALKNEIVFYPCGRKDTDNFDKTRFLTIISYSYCLEYAAFASIVGSFLQDINLTEVDLHGAYLCDVDLSYANISHTSLYNTNFDSANLESVNFFNTEFWQVNLLEANLSNANFTNACFQYGVCFSDGTNLTNTDFSGAEVIGIDFSYSKLQCANFSGANLQSSNFHKAKLSHANFTNTALRYVDFTGANLSNTNFCGANLTDIYWDKNTKWENILGLETAINIPEALKQQLGLE